MPEYQRATIYYVSPLPVPLSCAPYRTLEEQNLRDDEERRGLESTRATTVHTSVDPDKCTHPSNMVDDNNNTCVSCGMCYGARAAPITENDGYGGAHHALSSAAASAAARLKRKALTAASAEKNTGCIDISESAALSERRPARKVPPVPPDSPEMAAARQIAPDQIKAFDIIVSHARGSGFGGDSLETKRARFLSKLANDAFGDGALFLANGSYIFTDGATVRAPCGEATALIASGEETEESLNEKILGEVYRVVATNSAYFNSAQRRRLHHLSLFVVILAAHLRVVHSGAGAEGIDTSSASMCLELDRVKAGAKPSQALFVPRALPAAIAQRLKVNATCSTRLVQQAFALASGGHRVSVSTKSGHSD